MKKSTKMHIIFLILEFRIFVKIIYSATSDVDYIKIKPKKHTYKLFNIAVVSRTAPKKANAMEHRSY